MERSQQTTQKHKGSLETTFSNYMQKQNKTKQKKNKTNKKITWKNGQILRKV